MEEYLGLSSSWNEDEIWQALISLADRHRFQEPQLSAETKVSPKVIIFVDGLDESSTHERWVERIQETNAIAASYPQIRFCFTARPTAFKGRIDYAKVERLSNVGDVPAHMLFDSYMRAYNIKTQNNGWLKYSLTSPLALKLFCELNQDQTVSLSNRTEVSMTVLWRKKIEKIEIEYCENVNRPTKNQYALRAIVILSKQFVDCTRLEHSSVVGSLGAELKITTEHAESLTEYLEGYGILPGQWRTPVQRTENEKLHSQNRTVAIGGRGAAGVQEHGELPVDVPVPGEGGPTDPPWRGAQTAPAYSGTRRLQARPVPRSATYLRDAGAGERHGCENPFRHAGSCVRDDDAGHLHPHHQRYAAFCRRQYRPKYRQGGATGSADRARAERYCGFSALCGEEKETGYRLRHGDQRPSLRGPLFSHMAGRDKAFPQCLRQNP